MKHYTDEFNRQRRQRDDGTLVDHRIKPKGGGWKCERFDYKRVIALRRQGMSYNLIALRLGRSNPVGIYKVIQRKAPELLNVELRYTLKDGVE